MRNNEDPTTTSAYTDFFAPNGSLVVSGDVATGADAILQARAAMLPTDGSVQWDVSSLSSPNRIQGSSSFHPSTSPTELMWLKRPRMKKSSMSSESCSHTFPPTSPALRPSKFCHNPRINVLSKDYALLLQAVASRHCSPWRKIRLPTRQSSPRRAAASPLTTDLS